jgi:hypothetical protein
MNKIAFFAAMAILLVGLSANKCTVGGGESPSQPADQQKSDQPKQ